MNNRPPALARDVRSLREYVAAWRRDGLKVAVVPTMGALHDGHLELVRQGFVHAQRVITTIFINPKQFAAHEDLGRYPRDENGDLAKLASVGTSLVYAPALQEIYSSGFATVVSVGGPAKVQLEDKFRPQFFDGVSTIVAKLFVQTTAEFAIFGEKDFQQLKVVTRMARDLDMPTEVVGVPTLREMEGLALSSRNAYLSTEERQQAVALIRTLTKTADAIRAGVNPESATHEAEAALAALGFKVDYVAARNALTLEVPTQNDEPLRLLAAVWLGKTRLIDNIAV